MPGHNFIVRANSPRMKLQFLVTPTLRISLSALLPRYILFPLSLMTLTRVTRVTHTYPLIEIAFSLDDGNI